LLNIVDDSDHKFDIPATVCTNVAEQYAFSASFFILLISVFFLVAHYPFLHYCVGYWA